MGDLLKLIAAEGFYEISRAEAWKGGVMLSRREFAQTMHVIPITVDGVLWLAKGGFLPDLNVAPATPRRGLDQQTIDRTLGRIR